MTLIDSLGLLAVLLLGGVSGWLIAVGSHHRSAERQRIYEEEMADRQEVYAAWAMLRRTRCDESPDICQPEE